jgi:hypothetical protein
MDAAQTQPLDSPAGGHKQRSLVSTILTISIAFALLMLLNFHRHTIPFQGVEANAYGFPLLTAYSEPNGDTTKLDPATQINWLTLYFDIFFCAMILVCSARIVRRLSRR